MTILKLDLTHRDDIQNVFYRNNVFTLAINSRSELNDDLYSSISFETYSKTYLSDLNNFQSFGIYQSNQLQAIISLFQSNDEPAWYLTGCCSIDSSVISQLLDYIIELQEKDNRLKFYVLLDSRSETDFNSFFLSKTNNFRYDYFDEFVVPAKTKCFYDTTWELLFGRNLITIQSTMRCYFLTQEFRQKIPIGGSI